MTWEELAGVVNVSPREKIDSLPNVVLKRFEADCADTDDALRRLTRAREVKQWLKRNGIEQRDFSASPDPLAGRKRTLPIALADSSVRTILNTVLRSSGRYYWAYFRYGRDNRFFSLTLS